MHPGRVIGGFRVGRLLGRGSRGAVHEALQLSLERSVALRLLRPTDFHDVEDESRFLAQQRLAAALHHPGVVPTYEAGEWEGGRFVAMRYVRGRTLADALEAGEVSREDAPLLLAQLEAALEAAHGGGLVHGRISARNVLIDGSGSALLSDLGLGRSGTAADDAAALEDLRGLVERNAGARRRPRVLVPAIAAVAAALAVAVMLVTSGSADQDLSAEPAPAVAAGAEPEGSALAPGSAESVGCAAEPGPNTPVCTLAQAMLAGTSARVREAGAIRGWAVRNASGDLALQVVGFRDGSPFLRSFSQFESVHDLGPHSFAADIRVGRGDLVGVTLAPGAAIGARHGDGAATARMWSGTVPYAPAPTESNDLDEELLLRVDVEPGARPGLTQLRGHRAAVAPDGATLAAQVVRAPDGQLVRTELTRVDDGLAIDSIEGGVRVARADVEGAGADGRLLSFSAGCGFEHGLCLRWQNDGDPQPVVHAYRLTSEGAFRQIG